MAEWLARKAPADYWRQPGTADSYASDTLAHYQRLLHEGRLPCRHVVWHVTNRCNLLCSHCGVRGGETRYQELSLDDFASALPALLRLGLKYLTLSGGEPLLRKDLFKIFAVLRLCKISSGMVTNGHHFGRFEQGFRAHPPDSLSISIDGLKANHDQLRLKAGSFEQTFEALRLAQAWQLPLVSVNTSVWPDNLADLPELRDRIFAAGAVHWVLRPITASGRGAEGDYGLNQRQLNELLEFAASSLYQGYDLSVGGLGYLGAYDSWLNMTPFFAHVGWDSFYLLPDGQIKGFNEEHLPVEGHLLKDDLETLWYQGFRSYREAALPEICTGCPYLGRCHGGNHAEAETGTRCIRPLLEDIDREQSARQLLERLQADYAQI